jgi:hypothetical protein
MSAKPAYRQNRFALASLTLVAAIIISGCRKPAEEAQPQPSPSAGTATPASNQPAPASEQADAVGDGLSAVAVRILNKGQRSGSVILRGQCGPHGLEEQYHLPHAATLEPMDKALQEISAKYQNIYWRESRTSGVRIADAMIKAKLLGVRVREFRIVEDREPDRVMAVLWHAPEVERFLRHNGFHFARRADGARKVLSPPMIVEMKNATVADILDRIAAGYRQSPPKVWVYQECGDKKEVLIDVHMQ